MGRDRRDSKRSNSPSRKRRSRSRSESSSESRRSELRVSRGSKKKDKKEKKRSSRQYETPEERIARKREKRVAKMARTFGYSNEDNPFGDSNLTEQFVWKKKEQRDGQSKPTDRRKLAQKHIELVDEIKKVRQRRDEREAEREERERLKNEEARLRDASQYEDWQQKEEEFHLSQARIRSHIRIREGREKPIDTMAKNVLMFGAGDDEGFDPNIEIELREPYKIFSDLKFSQIKELREEIRTYIELEGNGPNREFWSSLMIVCKDELDRAEQKEQGYGIHKSVNEDIERMLESKSPAALESMEKDIENTIETADSGIDVEYWEGVLKQLIVFKAKAKLKEIHAEMLKKQLSRLQERRKELGNNAVNKKSDRRESQEHRKSDRYDDSAEARNMYALEEEKGLDESEEEFGQADEIDMPLQTYSWNDKYRPRKPRYFNRVKTGYDWNKYNQTHYDHDNPPPKVVQGYKFNLFYPDLIDKSKAPQYFLEKADSQEFCIIRFHAGPPYEDIAFKIVNREWECSHKRGFKSVFERGILHLYFNFKRHRYRR